MSVHTSFRFRLVMFLFLVSGLAGQASGTTPIDAPQSSPLPLEGQCMKANGHSVADYLYRDHDNYRTLSRALYPTEGQHSLIVWVNIEWSNGTTSLAGVRDSWGWSTSCLYVVLPLELFPLLSIWVFNPQQRMKEATVVLPPFCSNVTADQANSALYLSIKQMEAYVRNRDDPDPTLSMAQCVVALDHSGSLAPFESDDVGLEQAYFLFYLNLVGLGLLVLALLFLGIQYVVDWVNVDQFEGSDNDLDANAIITGVSYQDHDDGRYGMRHPQFTPAVAVDGRGRPVAATDPLSYGSVDNLYVNEDGHVVHHVNALDEDESDDDQDEGYDVEEADSAANQRGQMGQVQRSNDNLYSHETGPTTAAAAARRNSRHRLHEGEVAQIKDGLQRCRARVVRLRSELGTLEDDLALGTPAASRRAADRIKIANGEARMIEQEIMLSEAEAYLLQDAGVCSLFKVKEIKYDFLMMKREMLDLKKRLWEAEKAAWTAEAEHRRRKQRSAVWENYLKALIASPLLCDLLCAGFMAFLIKFYISTLGIFPSAAVIPLLAVNLVCFTPWFIDFVLHRLGSLAFLLCCSCFLLCDRRRPSSEAASTIISSRGDEDALENESCRPKANVWVLLPVFVVFVVHFAFFLTWIVLATMFDFAYSLEIICILAVVLFHLFMAIKLVLKVVRRARDDELERRRSVRARTREHTDYYDEVIFDTHDKDEARAAEAAEEDDQRYRCARTFGWCPNPVRSCLGGWVWFLLMMLSLLASLVVFLLWLHTGYHTFARQQTAGLQLLLALVTLMVLLLERQIINLDMSRRGYVRSFPRLVRRLLTGER